MDAVRRGLVTASARVRGGAWAVLQCALGAAIAWQACVSLLGHPRPFFASVAVVVCLGLRSVQRLRRVGELAVGVTLGVLVGDLLVSVIGSGTWQLGLVVAVALLIALALDGGPLVTAQAGLQAVFVVALPRTPGAELARWEDALVGGGVALAVAALLPADPCRELRVGARDVLGALSSVLRTAASAVETGDVALAEEALARARAVQPAQDRWVDAVLGAAETVRLSPLRRGIAGSVAVQAVAAPAVDRAVRNLRVLLRRLVVSLETGEPVPPRLPEELQLLADAVDVLGADLAAGRSGERAGVALRHLAHRLTTGGLGAHGVAGAVALAQLRVALVELLVASGTPLAQARAVLPPLD